jgi:uncharacterized protein YydD (DUF2326 family)
MLLRKIYSNPPGLFPEVKFSDGINFIFGKKVTSNNPKNSLNGIGKSTFLDLIDFCLLCSAQTQHNPRLSTAKHILKNHQIILDFEVDGIGYSISRSMDKPSVAQFGELGKIKEYGIDELKTILCDLVFYNSEYPGKYSSKWYRSLMQFYLKIQKHKKDKFSDPLHYIQEASPSKLMIYILFLMGIDNSLAKKNFDLQSELATKDPALKEIKDYIEENNLKDLSQAQSEVRKLRSDIQDLERTLGQFKLEEQYADAEARADVLTQEIKNLWYENFIDRSKIESYEKSYSLDIRINPRRIEEIYKDLSRDLAASIRKTLEDAIKFRTELAASRKSFIAAEITKLSATISSRTADIHSKDQLRRDLYSFLETKGAMRDLTGAFRVLTEKKRIVSSLESQVQLYRDIEKEKASLRIEEAKLDKEIMEFIDHLKGEADRFSILFTEIYNAIYPEEKNNLTFDIATNIRSKKKVDIKIVFPAEHSKGKNRGKTLVFDLMILLNSVQNNLKAPKFLVHDGIFDGVDKAHFVALYDYLEQLKLSGKKFQYIIPINEEGTLNDRFGAADKVSPEKIAQEAILVLTPEEKLLGDF